MSNITKESIARTTQELSDSTRLVILHKKISSLYKVRLDMAYQVTIISDYINELTGQSKALQIKIFEEAGKITKCPEFTAERKLIGRQKKQPSEICPADVEKYLDSLDKKDKDLFVANLLRQM